MRWYIDVLKKYAVFSGRARRKEYWMYTLFNCIALAVLLGLGVVVNTMIPYLLYLVAIIVPTLAVAVRRLHDTGKSGWFILLNFIPLVGGLIALVFMCLEGQRHPNTYGSDPKAPVDSPFVPQPQY
ncbi:DUF805 domain-containing protein [Actinacidiphila acidipaludis]|uniref:DUF805 domain-containing protein n=1 Tax=Actinacidiphila acidipaludis TaxID=2873382 RepID=A0ABS7Q9S7_9ACTN|nr:DUF805 domain-containing protein [Streptomyces acidipaludis]MBY8879920.1 DUF805 domain-containing protein [Streptomyces acidipaludis]